MARDISRDIKRLMRDMDDIREEVASMARNVTESSTQKGHDALARADKLRARARERAMYAEKRAGEEIESHPFLSLLAAIGVGFLIAKLLDAGRMIGPKKGSEPFSDA